MQAGAVGAVRVEYLAAGVERNAIMPSPASNKEALFTRRASLLRAGTARAARRPTARRSQARSKPGSMTRSAWASSAIRRSTETGAITAARSAT